MIKGIYTSASGMLPRILKQEIAANNMANVNTVGYKKDDVFTQVLRDVAKDNDAIPWETPMVDDVYIDYGQGSVERTDNPQDIAIEGNGFLVVETPNGERYSRSGNMQISPMGILTDGQGNPVLSDSGPIAATGNDIVVGADGTIAVDGVNAGRLKIMDFEKPYKLKKVDGGYFMPSDPAAMPRPAADYTVRQGYLEKSNVNIVEEMVEMLSSFRIYEAGQKAIQSQDETLEKAVTELGRVI